MECCCRFRLEKRKKYIQNFNPVTGNKVIPSTEKCLLPATRCFPRCRCSALARGAPLCAPPSKLRPADPAHPSLLRKGTANARAQRLSHGHPTAAAQTQECVGSKILRIYPPKTWKTSVNTLRACQPPYPRAAQSTSRAQTQPLNHQRANSKPWNSQSWCFTCIASRGYVVTLPLEIKEPGTVFLSVLARGGCRGTRMASGMQEGIGASVLPSAACSRLPQAPTTCQRSVFRRSFRTPLEELTWETLVKAKRTPGQEEGGEMWKPRCSSTLPPPCVLPSPQPALRAGGAQEEGRKQIF